MHTPKIEPREEFKKRLYQFWAAQFRSTIAIPPNPLRCDFCYKKTNDLKGYMAESFMVAEIDTGHELVDEGKWGACSDCAEMIDAGAWDRLVGHSVEEVFKRHTKIRGSPANRKLLTLRTWAVFRGVFGNYIGEKSA